MLNQLLDALPLTLLEWEGLQELKTYHILLMTTTNILMSG